MSVDRDIKFASEIVFDLDDESTSTGKALQHRDANNDDDSDGTKNPDPFAHCHGHLWSTIPKVFLLNGHHGVLKISNPSNGDAYQSLGNLLGFLTLG